MQIVLGQVEAADERFGRMLNHLQKSLDSSGHEARVRASALLRVAKEGRWSSRHAFTGARDSRIPRPGGFVDCVWRLGH